MNKITIIILLFISVYVCADTSPEAMQFWGSRPSNATGLGKGKVFIPKDLDKAIVDILEGKWSVYPVGLTPKRYLGYKMEFDKKNRPTKYIGHQVDLNKDGKDEYFIIIPGGGTGGPMYIVISFLNGKWREIGDFQGWSISLIPSKNAWCSILTVSKSGQEHLVKGFAEFSNGKYRIKRVEYFDGGKITKKELKSTTKAVQN